MRWLLSATAQIGDGREPLDAGTLLAVAGCSLVFSLLLLHPLPIVAAVALPHSLGDALLNSWILGWTSERLLDGLRGVWDAPIFYPNRGTLAYSEHLLGVTVLVAPVYWLTGNGILAHNVAVILSFVIAGVSMFLLAHALTGRRDAALLAALAFAFSPLRLGGQLTRIQMMMVAWLPLVLWALHRYAATGHARYVAAATVAFLFLGLSNTYLLIYSAPAVVSVGAYAAWTAPARLRRTIALVVASVAVLALVLVPVALQYLAVQREFDFVRTPAEIRRYSAEPASYLSVGPNSPLRGLLRQETTADRALFPGFVLLSLAVASLLRPGRSTAAGDRAVRLVYLIVISASLMLSLGPRTLFHAASGEPVEAPYAWFMPVVPPLSGFRAPARFGFVVGVAVASLAAIGAGRILARVGVVTRAVILGTGIVGILAEGYGGPLKVAYLSTATGSDERQAYEWLASSPPGAVLELPVSFHATLLPSVAGATPSVVYQYATLAHKHPLVNGASGFSPPMMRYFEGRDSPWTDRRQIPDALAAMRVLGVRYVLVHRARYKQRWLADDVVAAILASRQATKAMEFGGTVALTLDDELVEEARKRRVPEPVDLLERHGPPAAKR